MSLRFGAVRVTARGACQSGAHLRPGYRYQCSTAATMAQSEPTQEAIEEESRGRNADREAGPKEISAATPKNLCVFQGYTLANRKRR
jgi:hypothetical protein